MIRAVRKNNDLLSYWTITVLVGGEEPQMMLAASTLTALIEHCFTSHRPRTICLCLVTSPASLSPELLVKLVKNRGNGITNEGGIRHEQRRYKDRSVDKELLEVQSKAYKPYSIM